MNALVWSYASARTSRSSRRAGPVVMSRHRCRKASMASSRASPLLVEDEDGLDRVRCRVADEVASAKAREGANARGEDRLPASRVLRGLPLLWLRMHEPDVDGDLLPAWAPSGSGARAVVGPGRYHASASSVMQPEAWRQRLWLEGNRFDPVQDHRGRHPQRVLDLS